MYRVCGLVICDLQWLQLAYDVGIIF